MSSAENRQHASPGVPPTFSADDHESRDYYVGQKAPQPPPNQAPYLTPYLGLRARLSQIWINRWTILLLLVLVRTLFAIGSIDDGLDIAKAKAMSACQSTEKVGTALASAPFYVSKGLNTMAATGIEKAVNGLMSMVGMAITAVEEIVVFVIGMLTNTYLCLVTLVVRGSMQAALDLTKKANDALKGMTEKLGDGLGDAAKAGQDGINKIATGIGSLTGQKLPQLDFKKQIDDVKNLKLPGDLTKDLEQLEKSIPTFDQVKSETEKVIRLPFEELKKLVKTAMGNYTFNGTVLPLAAKDTVSFCGDGPDGAGINQIFLDLENSAKTARKIFLLVLLIAAAAVCIPMAFMEVKKHQRQQKHAKLLRDEATDSMDAVYIASRPWTSRIGIWLSRKCHSTRAQILARWAVAYATSVPALFVLSLAVAGLFACLCQYILLIWVKDRTPGLTAKIANGTGNVVAALNNASSKWSIDVNKAITAENQKINKNLFGWVQTSTTAVNNTLNTFVDQVHDTAQKFLGGTPLQAPLEDLFKCLIGLKIEAFQKGLTWAKDNAHFDFPMIKNDTLSLAAMADLTDSNKDNELLNNPSGTAQRVITESVTSLINKLLAGVRQEAIISTCLLIVWFIIIIGGTVTAYLAYLKGGKLRGEGGNEYDFSDTGHTPNVTTYPRPESAAPPYQSPNADVNPNAPYTLNFHPFPSHSGSRDVDGKNGAGATTNGGINNFSRPSYNEKSGNGEPF